MCQLNFSNKWIVRYTERERVWRYFDVHGWLTPSSKSWVFSLSVGYLFVLASVYGSEAVPYEKHLSGAV